MSIQYLADETTIKNAKSARTFSIVAISSSGAYLIVGLFSLLFALFPFPVIGLLITFWLSMVESTFLFASIGFGIYSLIRACSLVKKINAMPDSSEKREAFGCAKLARLLSILSLIATGATVILLSVLNVFEFILSLV